MEIKIINSKEDFKVLQPEWELLEKKTDRITFYSTYNFTYQWWEVNETNTAYELFVICIYEKSELIGVAPLMSEKRRLFHIPFKTLKFIGIADFHDFIIDKHSKTQSVIKKVFDVINEKSNFDKIELTHIAQYSELSNFFLKSDIYNSSFRFLGENPIVNLNNHDDFVAYKKRFFKKNINYYRNKLKKDYEPSFEVIYDNKNDILASIATVHENRNSDSKSRRSLFSNSKKYALINKLYKLNKGNTITFVLKSKEGNIISYATCYLYKDIVHNWNTSFNLQYKDYSAGDLIYFEMINYLFENKETFKKLDLGAGRYPWKFRMTNDFITTHKLNYNRNTSKKYYLLSFYDKLFRIGKIIYNRV